MLPKINKRLEKMMPLITPISVVLGVLLAEYLENYSFLIPWLFAFMTFAGSLSSNFATFKEAVTHPRPLIWAVFILHFVMPVWAWGFGHLSFSGDTYTITGLVLAMAIPTGITSFVWVSIYRGNIALTLSIILIDTILSPFIVPATLSFLVGQHVEMDVLKIMKGLFLMIVMPSLLGMALNQMTNGKVITVLSPALAPVSKISMALVVMINGAVVAPYMAEVDLQLIKIALAAFLIAFSGYLFSFLIGKLMRNDQETVIALTFSGGMRNISSGAVLAVSYFPAPVAVPVVMGMLFQQILASFYGLMLDRHFNKKIVEEGETV
ncbi:bile acid:sodium symporter family protein [Peribacillus glennii]|uniref:Bile acid:sodium symporter family protein n=1 Tax=Peribacillus glennii TaxID=2303991 RepID=A0A372LFX3_9BACI|nr:bile acid:sodium symporter family protein [Peribacillus glennii]RFU64979.1 bile acid:sodium symporter family protein [Peribacillus glennii]